MDDGEIIKLFFERNESAIALLDTKYGSLLRKVSYNILGDLRDSEECVNDAYLGVWNTVPPKYPNPLCAYVVKIVRNLSLNRYYKNSANKRGGGFDTISAELCELSDSSRDVNSLMEAKELAEYINSYLESISRENRVIFMLRYAFCEDYETISQKTKLGVKTVSVRLVRMRKALKKYLEDRGL